MQTILLGINHETATVELRERVALQGQRLGDALTRLTEDRDGNTVAEAVILSTCNRMEIYALTSGVEAGYQQLINLFAHVSGLPESDLQVSFYQKSGLAVAEHLYSVTSGINSMVIGENQIQGQVKQAFEAARRYGTIGPILSNLFQSALSVGKRVRSETAINENCLSISSTAVELVKSLSDDICGKKVLVLGTGKMSQLALDGLLKCGVKDLTVINRSMENARKVSEQLSIQAYGFDKLETFLQEAQVVISSTAAPHVIVTRDLMARILPKRTAKKLIIIDIAVPRDVEPEVGDLPGVTLFNVDDLKGRIEANREQRCREVQHVIKIINTEVDNFHAWYQTLEVQPIIKDLKLKSEEIRLQEVKHALRRLNTELTDNDIQILEDLSRRIVNKILHRPFVRLREEAIIGNGHHYTAAVRNLFGLEERAEKSGSPL